MAELLRCDGCYDDTLAGASGEFVTCPECQQVSYLVEYQYGRKQYRWALPLVGTPDPSLSVAKQLAERLGGRWTYSIGDRGWWDAIRGGRIGWTDLPKLGIVHQTPNGWRRKVA